MKAFIIIIVIILIALAAYFGLKKSPAPVTNPVTNGGTSAPLETTNPGASATAPSAQTESVSIKNFNFSPQSLTVKAGTTVTWTNDDSVPHTVTSDSGNVLASGTIAPGHSFSFTFGSAGTYSYHCSIHPMMKGSVTVQ